MNPNECNIPGRQYLLFKVCAFITLVGGAFLFWYYYVDGIYMNRVIKFTHEVEPMNLQMVKETYKVGEIPRFQTAFCKTRDAVAVTKWTLVNEHPHYDNVTERIVEIPVGCYPDHGGLQQGETKPISVNTPPGEYNFVGVTTHTLPDGRQRKQYYRTEHFEVVP